MEHDAFDKAPISVGGRAIKPGLVIAAMCMAVLLIIASVSSLNVALPSIGRELAATQSQVQWIVDIFALVLAAMLLPAGALGDRFGRRRVMLIGFGVFIAAGIWAALADSVGQLLIARGIGGLGAALIFPGTLSTLTGSLPPEQRGKGIGLWAASASLGGTIGSLASGALIEGFWYGSIFLAFTLFALAIAIGTVLFVPETSDPDHANVDPVGSVLSLVGIGGLVLAIIEGPVKGWTDAITLFGFAAALVGLVGFALYELRTARPLLDVRVFAQRSLRVGSISIFAQYLAVFGFFFTAAQYLAFVRGYGPFHVAVAFLPLSPVIPFTSTKAPVWARRYGRNVVGGTGLALMAAGAAVFAQVDADSPYLLFAAGLVLFGAGMGLSAPPATEAIVEALPRAKQGVASAVNDLSRELGGALGIAILGSALTAGYRRSVDHAATTIPTAAIDPVRDSPAVGYEIAAASGPDAGSIIGVIHTSLVDGYSLAMWITAAFLAIGAVYVGLRAPSETTPARPVLEPIITAN